MSLSGFFQLLRKGLKLSIGARLTINFILSAAAIEEEVTVTAESPMVKITKTEISSIVDRQKIDDLPLFDRNYASLSFIKAGVQDD